MEYVSAVKQKQYFAAGNNASHVAKLGNIGEIRVSTANHSGNLLYCQGFKIKQHLGTYCIAHYFFVQLYSENINNMPL